MNRKSCKQSLKKSNQYDEDIMDLIQENYELFFSYEQSTSPALDNLYPLYKIYFPKDYFFHHTPNTDSPG